MKRKTRRKLITFCLSCLLSCFSGVRADGLRPQAEELIERGEQLETQNDARGALKAFERGLDISRELGDETLVTRCLIAIAAIYITLAETSKALSASEQALLAARRAGDRHQEAQVNRRIAGLQKRLIENGLAPDERRAVIEELNQAERDYDGLTVEIKRRSPRYALLRKPRSLSLEGAQSLLGDGSAIVAYMLSKESVLAFVITAGSLHVERLAAPPGFVTARVENLIDLISEDKAEGWRQASRSLYQDLFAPLIEHLPSQIKRLVIVPDGALHYLPFEILLQEGGQDRYLLEDYTISYAPSATVLAQLADPASTESTSERADLILFADPQLSPVLLAQNAPTGAGALTRALYEDEGLQVSPIPFSASEANVVSRYAGEGSAIYTGKEASERRVKSDRLDRFRIIHFATHGLVSQQRPSRSALVLASGEADGEDGFLQAREIYNLRLASDLVVLSACQTAHGRVLAGEGIEGLARAFFYAGSKSVVASLWDVSDERTTRFMEVFYKYLASGRPKAEALRLAKLDLLKDSKTSAPRYWAPFILVGEGDRIVAMSALPWWKQQIWWLIGGLAMLMLTLLAISVLRRRRPAQFLPVSDISSQ